VGDFSGEGDAVTKNVHTRDHVCPLHQFSKGATFESPLGIVVVAFVREDATIQQNLER